MNSDLTLRLLGFRRQPTVRELCAVNRWSVPPAIYRQRALQRQLHALDNVRQQCCGSDFAVSTSSTELILYLATRSLIVSSIAHLVTIRHCHGGFPDRLGNGNVRPAGVSVSGEP